MRIFIVGWFLSGWLGMGWGAELPVLEWRETPPTEADWEKIARQDTPFRLKFSWLRLTPAEMARIAENRNVTELVLWGCKGLDGECFRFLEKMPQLRSLSLGYCKKVTDDDLRFLAGLTELRVLNLNDLSKISDEGLSHLAGLENLEELYLAGSAVSEKGFRKLAALRHLKAISVSTCKQIDDATIAFLCQTFPLEKLFFGNCTQVTDAAFEAISACSTLRSLHFSGCHRLTDEAIVQVATLENLECLWMGNNSNYTNRAWASLKNLSHLKELSLERTSMSDMGMTYLADLTRLESLELRYCERITDVGLYSLEKMTSMRILDLGGNQIRGDGLEPLQGMKNLEQLNLGQNALESHFLYFLTPFTKMKSLRLQAVQIRPSDFRFLERMPLLEHLELKIRFHLTDDVMWYLRDKKHLKSLNVQECGMLTDKWLDVLRGMPSLEHLTLKEFAISEKGLKRIAALPSLRTLTLWRHGLLPENLRCLEGANQLERLCIDGPHLRDGTCWKYLPYLPRLKYADVLRIISDDDCEYLRQVPLLQELQVKGGTGRGIITKKGLATLKHCSQIRSLTFEHIFIQDSDLAVLAEMPHLETLYFRKCPQLTGEFLNHFPENSCLKSLLFDKCFQLQDRSLENLSRFPLLKELFLVQCYLITDEGIAFLSRVPQVTRCCLRNIRLSDRGLAALKDWKECRELCLTEVAITDEGLAFLQNFHELERLDLERTLVTDEGLAFLKNCPKLVELSLGHTAVTGTSLSELSQLWGLNTLKMSNTRMEDKELQTIATWQGLKHLHLQECRFLTSEGVETLQKQLPDTDIVWSPPRTFPKSSLGEKEMPLKEMPLLDFRGMPGAWRTLTNEEWEQILRIEQLCVLDLSWTTVTLEDIQKLRPLPIYSLKLHGAAHLDDTFLEELSLHPRIWSLGLGKCEQVTATGWKFLGRMRNLKELSVWSNPTWNDDTMACLEKLSSLQTLWMGDTSVTDKSLHKLYYHYQLQELSLNGCSQITDQGLAFLRAFPQLRTLFLGRTTQLTEKGLRSLEFLPGLEWVELPIGLRSNEGLAALEKNKELQTLVLDGGTVDDTGLQSLRSLEKLSYLSLNDCSRITPQGLEVLWELPHLREVEISGCLHIPLKVEEAIRMKFSEDTNK